MAPSDTISASAAAEELNKSQSFNNATNAVCDTVLKITRLGTQTKSGSMHYKDIQNQLKSLLPNKSLNAPKSEFAPANPAIGPNGQKLIPLSENGIPTDWGFIDKQALLDAQLADDEEWDMCPELETFRFKEGTKTWNQIHRERILELIERRKILNDGMKEKKRDSGT